MRRWLGFVVLALLMIPAAWYAGRIDRIPLPKTTTSEEMDDATAGMAVKAALGNASFVAIPYNSGAKAGAIAGRGSGTR